MKKLTAGIFSVLMGLVSVNAAEAAVASKGYVDAKIGDTGDQTVVEMINSVSSGSSEATEALAGRVDTVEGAIETLNGDESVPGSVAKKIADAITAEDLTNKFAAKEDVSNKANGVTDGMNKEQMYPTVAFTESLIAGANQNMSDMIGEVADNKTVVQMITEGDSALDGRVDALEADNTTNKADITAIKAEQAIQNSDIDALQATVNTLNGDGDGSIAKQIETVTQKVTQVETDYKAADTALDTKLTKAIADGDADTLAAAKAADAEQTNTITTAYQAADTALKTELQGYADTAEADAITKAGENADTKISNLNLAALSRVPAECSSETSYCVLTTDGENFLWEAIERATGETQTAGKPIPAVVTQ